MTMISRRSALSATASLAGVVALAGCVTAQQVVTTIVSDGQLVVNGINAVLTTSGIAALIGAANVTAIEGYLADAKTALADLQAVATTVGTSATVQSLVNAAQQVLSILSGFGVLPGPLEAVASAILGLLPALLSAAGITSVAVKKTRFTPLSPVAARAVLATV